MTKTIILSVLALTAFLWCVPPASAQSVPGHCVSNCDIPSGSDSSGHVNSGLTFGDLFKNIFGSVKTPEPKPRDSSYHQATQENMTGNNLFAAGRYAEAIAAYRKALTLDPNDPVIRGNLMRALYAHAHDQYHSHTPDNAAGLLRLERAVEEIKSLADARPDFDSAKMKFDAPLSTIFSANDALLKDIRGKREAMAGMDAAKRSNSALVSDLKKQISTESNVSSAASSGMSFGDPNAGEQLKSVDHHGGIAKILENKEASSAAARKGFDTGGEAAGGLPKPEISGAAPVRQDPVVPEGKRTPEITALEQERTVERQKIKELEEKLQTIDAKKQPVELAKAKQKKVDAERKVQFLNFSISEKIELPKKDASAKGTGGK